LSEGDTILRTARRLARAMRGDVVVEVESPNPRGRSAGLERLVGETLEEVESRGKNLVLHFGELALHSHLGMNGSWHVYSRGERWRKPRYAAWAVLRGERDEAVQFGGPTLRILRADALRRDPVLSRLGPDVLAPGFEPADTIPLLRAAADRELGDLLLDQGRVAGIGNIFKSEACFTARIDPWRAVGELEDEELERVLRAARELMLVAVETGRHPHNVYKRANWPCLRCGTPIRSRGQGDDNRTTYWCPHCQA
jgi:endonuclease VIII